MRVNDTAPYIGAPESAYADFLQTKSLVVQPSGIEVPADAVHPSLKGHQRDMVRWGARKGRGGFFARTGLGKTRTFVETLRVTTRRALVIAPLGVTRQTLTEAAAIGVDAAYARSQADAPAEGITVTNYDMIGHFDPDAFDGVTLDEGSILKDVSSKTRARLTDMFRDTPYRYVATATPSPNSIEELANYAEFLGICTRGEMLATWFVNANKSKATGNKADTGQEYMLRGHARESFYRWLSTWAMSLKLPSDLGHDDDGYILPELSISPVIVPTDYVPPGQMFATSLKGITDRARVRKSTVAERVQAAVEIINRESDEPWIVWCGLNDEQDTITAALGEQAVSVYGSLDPDEKLARLDRWTTGERPVLVTKPSIFGHGLNLQRCARMVFVGLSDSFEAYHQAIRRCWRFGQTRPVNAHVVLTDLEEPIYANVLRKEREFEHLTDQLVRYVGDFQRAEVGQMRHREDVAHVQPLTIPSWLQGAA